MQRVLIHPCPHVQPPPLSASPSDGTSVRGGEPALITSSPAIHSLHQLTPGGVRSVGLNKCVMTYVHHYSITQVSFTALNILHVLPVHPLPSQGVLFKNPGLFISKSSSWLRGPPLAGCHCQQMCLFTVRRPDAGSSGHIMTNKGS